MKRSGLIACWSFDDGMGKLARDEVSGLPDPVHYLLNDAEFVPARDPQWRTSGVRGGALLFDGCSTWVRREAGLAPVLDSAMTAAVWVAPRSFEGGEEGGLSAIVNRHNREQGEGYLLGLYRHGSWSLQLGLAGDWTELWAAEEHSVPAWQWSHLAATYDSSDGSMKLYLNGREAASRCVAPGKPIRLCGEDLLIGRNNGAVLLGDSFPLHMFDGLMDELRLYDRALSGEEILSMYREDLEVHGGAIPAVPYDQIRLDRTPFLKDRHRPGYHASPPCHWMNEPHAPFYYNGQYHLFYQHNPRGPYFHQIHWGHWVSDDLVFWRDLPIALAPERGTDPDGVWSGSAAYDASGRPVLFYTAGDHRYVPNQWVAVARPAACGDRGSEATDPDLIRWDKDPRPLVKLEEGIRGVGDFRDPFVWREDGRWYMLVGSSTEEHRGTAYGYVSEDMEHWEFKGSFYDADSQAYPYLGPIWELPVLLPLGEDRCGRKRYVFLISPVGPGSDVEIYYWMGGFDQDRMRFLPDTPAPELMDFGDFHFTGPSGMKDPKTGRSLLFTICQGDRTDRMNYLSGWAHNAGLPVELFLREDGRLGLKPIEELAKLRTELLVSCMGESVDEVNVKLAEELGQEPMLELRIEFESNAAGPIGLKVRQSPDGSEETRLFYDPRTGTFGVDRTRTSADPREICRGVQSGKLELNGESLKLHVYLDHSILEAYANDLKSVTTRCYPASPDAYGIEVWGEGGAVIRSLEIWRLRSIYI